jgi:hypothetical protein
MCKLKRPIEKSSLTYDTDKIKKDFVEMLRANNFKLFIDKEFPDYIKIKDFDLKLHLDYFNITIVIGQKTKETDLIEMMKIADDIIDSNLYYSKDWKRKFNIYFNKAKAGPKLLPAIDSKPKLKVLPWIDHGLELIYFGFSYQQFDDAKIYRFIEREDGKYFVELGVINHSFTQVHNILTADIETFERLLLEKLKYKFNRDSERFIKNDIKPLQNYFDKQYGEMFINIGPKPKIIKDELVKKGYKYGKTEKIKLPIGTFHCYQFKKYSSIECICHSLARKPGLCNDCNSKEGPARSGVCDYCEGNGICKSCDGKGCNLCEGTGKCFSCEGSGKCNYCKGTGKCLFCNGTGLTNEKYKTLVWYEVNTGIKLKQIQRYGRSLNGLEYLQHIGPHDILSKFVKFDEPY